VSLYYHRGIPDEAKIKHAVVKRVNERWYVCLMLELPSPAPRQTLTGHRVGVDIGLKALAAEDLPTDGPSARESSQPAQGQPAQAQHLAGD
jgi:hypothetical protein